MKAILTVLLGLTTASFCLANAPPTVSRISPTLGPVGQWVYVHGTSFVPYHTTVDMGGKSNIPAHVYASTQLGFRVPAGSEGTTHVVVRTSNGSAVSTDAYTIGVPDEAPSITGISPTLGPEGQWVYVSGTNFVHGETTVSFAGFTQLYSQVYGPTSLGFSIPQGAAGTSTVSVTTPKGSANSNQSFTVGIPMEAPVLIRLHEYDGSDWIYMTGANFVHGQTTIHLVRNFETDATVYGPSSLGFSPPSDWRSSPFIRVKTPNGMHQMRLERMVDLRFKAKSIARYQIQFSKDLETWNAVGSSFDGEDALFRMMATFGDDVSGFYRVITLQD